jgi:protein-disulfide isomerase
MRRALETSWIGVRVGRARTSARSALVVISIAAALACAGSPGADAPTDASDTGSRAVARIEGQEISLSELDARIKDDLFAEAFDKGGESRLYDARAETIEEMVDERLMERAAGDAGVSPAEWREQVLEEQPPLTDEEVAAFFEANRSRLAPTDTLEVVAPSIRRYLEMQRQQQAVRDLRERYDVWVGIDRPRHPVGAEGPSIGPADARITIVEFSDYECPYCARAEPVVKEILRRYPDDVRLVYRHLPLPFHANAQVAAEASLCAWDQDRFWEYHDLLFENQRELGTEQLTVYAGEAGLDLEAFAACVKDETTAERVRRDMEEASALGATGTPTFYINGMMVTGSRPVEEFEAMIEAELARLDG